jgi:hypothetical protein
MLDARFSGGIGFTTDYGKSMYSCVKDLACGVSYLQLQFIALLLADSTLSYKEVNW